MTGEVPNFWLLYKKQSTTMTPEVPNLVLNCTKFGTKLYQIWYYIVVNLVLNFTKFDTELYQKGHHTDIRSIKFETKLYPNLVLYHHYDSISIKFGTKLFQIWYCIVPKLEHHHDFRSTKFYTKLYQIWYWLIPKTLWLQKFQIWY